MVYKKDLENQIHSLCLQLKEVESQKVEDQNQLLSSVRKKEQIKEDQTKHSQEKQKEKACLDTKRDLGIVKKDLEEKLQDTETILKSVLCVVNSVTQKKNELNHLKEKMNKQLEEPEEQRNLVIDEHLGSLKQRQSTGRTRDRTNSKAAD